MPGGEVREVTLQTESGVYCRPFRQLRCDPGQWNGAGDFSLNRSITVFMSPTGYEADAEFLHKLLALILASIPFDVTDYVYDYELFKNIT